MDLIADINHSLRADWIFIVMLFVTMYLVFMQSYLKEEFRLFARTFFSLKASNQLQREKLSTNHLLYYFPIMIIVVSLLINVSCLDLRQFLMNAFWVALFFASKLLIMGVLIILFEIKQYQELIWYGFFYELIAGICLTPLLFLLFYGPFYKQDIRLIIGIALFLIFVYKLIRTAYISFFHSSFSKAHIIIYLCTLEILPLVIICKGSF